MNVLLPINAGSELEKSWWHSSISGPCDYDGLPSTSKWLCRISNHPKRYLDVWCDGSSYTFPQHYAAPFMLLDLQHLSSLSESMRLPRSSPWVSMHLHNVTFLNQMRIQILTESSTSRSLEDPQPAPTFERWITRLIHGIPNYWNEGVIDDDVIWELYRKPDERNWLQALLSWVHKNEKGLVNAAERSFSYALRQHMRHRGPDQQEHSARRWIDGIMYHLNTAFPTEPNPSVSTAAVKRGRGRPRKPPPPVVDDLKDTKIQTRSQVRVEEGLSAAINSIFRSSSLTESPKRKRPQVFRKLADVANQEDRVKFKDTLPMIETRVHRRDKDPKRSASEIECGVSETAKSNKIASDFSGEDKTDLQPLKRVKLASNTTSQATGPPALVHRSKKGLEDMKGLIGALEKFSKDHNSGAFIAALSKVVFDTEKFQQAAAARSLEIYAKWRKVYPLLDRNFLSSIRAQDENEVLLDTLQGLSRYFKLVEKAYLEKHGGVARP